MKRFTGFAQMLASCAEDYGELPALMGADGALQTVTYAQLLETLYALQLKDSGGSEILRVRTLPEDSVRSIPVSSLFRITELRWSLSQHS